MPVDVAVPSRLEGAAAPTWDALTQTLVWVDTPARQVHRYDPATGHDDVLELPQAIAAAKPRAIGGLVCNLTDGVALLDRDGARRWLVYWSRPSAGCAAAAVDPRGRLWAGTFGDAGGWLAVVEPDGAARVAASDVRSPSGLAWSPDETRMYLVDGVARRLDVFDYDASSGTVANRRPLVRFTDGAPSGVGMDAAGCLWVAVDGAGTVHRYTADGRLDRVLELPARRVTGCTFGGPRLTDLYLTTAEHDGALLVLSEAGAGLPTTAFAG